MSSSLIPDLELLRLETKHIDMSDERMAVLSESRSRALL